jgi:hypothetical protein
MVDTRLSLITIDTMNSPSERANAATSTLLAAALGERLTRIDFNRAKESYSTPEALAARMLEAVPDVVVSAPPIGPCYSSSALARWKQVSRQAIDQQRRSGRLFGVLVGRRMLYPSAQFDNHGRQSRAFAEMYADAGDREPIEFAIWMATPDSATALRPSDTLRLAPDTRTPHERLLEGFDPTIVQPPYGATAAAPGSKE